ncbi:restriction endonuclease [Noviherbaspirillum malthae]|uniref:restriction endonuclease n=1 Tax=Noviherbaspirillum malthae TaxID=1260987 RepID=UPI00188F3862|nr:restriction endonuclease [Noviherbaspirillum malthae]
MEPVAIVLTLLLVIFVAIFGWKVGTPIAVVLVCALLFWGWGRVAKRKEADIELSKDLIEKHVRELAMKRRQMTYAGSYGVAQTGRWEKEQRKFVDTVIRPARQRPLSIDQAAINTLIESALDEYVARTPMTDEPPEDLNGVGYEIYCAEQLRKTGWEAQTTVATGDQGGDLIATKGAIRLVVQCKYFSTSKVGNKAVQQAATARPFYEATYAAVISNADYTPAARQLAKASNVLLLHHYDIAELDSIILQTAADQDRA